MTQAFLNQFGTISKTDSISAYALIARNISRVPGLTKTSYHTVFIYEKLLVIQFHTIPYVQKIV